MKNYSKQSFKCTQPNMVYHLLLHASRIGAFIGKYGCIIKSLQQLTGARIIVNDAPFESAKRVISVIIKINGEGVGELPKPPEVLLTVFERVLAVAADEMEGSDVGDRVVSCRLLINSGQAGSVIGKGGKIVEKIKIDTGSRIRVLNYKLPVFSKPSDEIIEIQGNASSVKKALVAVASRLLDSHPFDRKKKMRTKPYEVFQFGAFVAPHEGLIDLNMDCCLQRNSALSTSSRKTNENPSIDHPWSAVGNMASTLDPEALQQQVTFRMICSRDMVGAIIGKGGSIIRALQNDTGATIIIGPTVVGCEDRLITITALENPESTFSPAQKAILLVFYRFVEGCVEKGLDLRSKESYVTTRLVVPSNQVGILLGTEGSIVSEIQKATRTSIRITGNGNGLVPKCASNNDQVVQISGQFFNVRDALYNATSRLRDHLFGMTQNCGGTGPYGRLRDSIPRGLGGKSVVGVNHGLTIHCLSQSIDHLSLSRNLDHSSSLGVWQAKAVGGINSRGINDVSRRLTRHTSGLELGSGSSTAIVTNTTVEIVVTNNILGFVYGKKGRNLDQLAQISGAKVIIHGPRSDTSNKTTIVLSGTPNETQAAQILLQDFILNGSS